MRLVPWVALIALLDACGSDDGGSAPETISGGTAGSTASGGATARAGSPAVGGAGTLPAAAGEAGSTALPLPAEGGAGGAEPSRTAGGSGGGSGSSATPGSGGAVDGGSAGLAGRSGAASGGSSGTPGGAAIALGFLVDSSASNNEAVVGQTRWSLTTDVLIDAVQQLDTSHATSLMFFPNVETPAGDECFVPNQPASFAPTDAMQRDLFIGALLSQIPAGNTPTHDAYEYALDVVGEVASASKYVVLVSDGPPNRSLGCMGDGTEPVDAAPVLDRILSALTDDGIKTVVVGSVGSEEARSLFSRMAIAGGTARPGCAKEGPDYCHIDLTTSLDLGSQLLDVLSR